MTLKIGLQLGKSPCFKLLTQVWSLAAPALSSV